MFRKEEEEEEEEEGFFGISVKLHERVRLKVIVMSSVEYRPYVDCFIRVPDPSNATAVAQGFTPRSTVSTTSRDTAQEPRATSSDVTQNRR